MEIFHLFFCFKRILSRSLKGFPDVHCGPWSGACCVCPVWTWAALGGFSFSLCSSGSRRGLRLSVRSGRDVGDSPSTRISTRSSLQAWRAAGLRLRVLRGSGSVSCGVRCRVAGPFAVLRRSSPELPFPSLWCGGGGSGNAALRSEGGCESGDAGPPSFSAVGGKDGDTGPAGMRGPGSAGVYAAGGSSRHCPGRGRHLLTAAVAARACLPRCASDMQLPRGLCRSAPVWQCVGDESPARTNETGNNESHL